MYELVDYGDNIPDSIFDGNGNQFDRVENDEPYSEAVVYQQVDKNVRSDHSMLKLIIINGTIYEWIPKLGSSNLYYVNCQLPFRVVACKETYKSVE